MTVGIPEWHEYPEGFPAQWIALLRQVRSHLHSGTRILYDLNYTDDAVSTVHGIEYGGEVVEWRKAIANHPSPSDPVQQERWQQRVAFWRDLDAVGIDLYRSLADESDPIPGLYEDLVMFLSTKARRIAFELGSAIDKIGAVTGKRQEVILKEVGFKSIEKGFIDPFTYSGPGTLNQEHQAAAFDAILRAFLPYDKEWFRGLVIWNASVDMERHGPSDPGFSPLGKILTEGVLSRYFLASP